MRILLIIVGVVAALAVVIVGIGMLLPREHSVSRSVVVAASADSVYAILADVAQYPSWIPSVKQVDLLPAVDGHSRFREHMRQGEITFETVEAVPPRKIVTRIVDTGNPFGGTWTIDLAATDAATTRVTITEDGWVSNPVFRVVGRYVIGLDATINQTLDALQARARSR